MCYIKVKDKKRCFRRAICRSTWSLFNQTRRAFFYHVSNVLGVCRGVRVRSHASYAEAFTVIHHWLSIKSESRSNSGSAGITWCIFVSFLQSVKKYSGTTKEISFPLNQCRESREWEKIKNCICFNNQQHWLKGGVGLFHYFFDWL